MAAKTLLPKPVETKNTYELLVILKPVVETDANNSPSKSVEDALAKVGATVANVDKMGRRRLPYMIDKQKDGMMVSIIADIPATELDNLRRAFKLNDDVLRVTMVQVSESDIEAIHKSAQLRTQGRGGPQDRNNSHRRGPRDNNNRDSRGPRPAGNRDNAPAPAADATPAEAPAAE